MDKCGTHSSPANLTKGRQLYYHGLSICMKPSIHNSSTIVTNMCHDSDFDTCTDYPINWAITSFTDKTNYGGDVGLARDGHVIKGPYNANGELWACDEHDICNGTYL